MIEFSQVSKKFNGKGIAGINGLSLKLGHGEILAVMGPNGSGKTTLINIIAGFITPDSGMVKLDGESCIFSGMLEVQDMNVQKYLIQRNIQDIDEEKKLQFARDFADIFEFTFQLKQNLSELSAGQKQKIALAAELINRPALLLLDEPFTHLDPHTRKDILNSLFTYIRNQETSVLWVTHELEEALKYSDRLGILNYGKFEQLDTPLAMVESPKNLFVAQFIGFENFIPIKKTNDKWQTRWGVMNSDLKTNLDEAILVIPMSAWKITDSGQLSTVTSHYLNGHEKCFAALLDEKEVQVTLPRSIAWPPVGSKLGLQANLEDCFLIPL